MRHNKNKNKQVKMERKKDNKINRGGEDEMHDYDDICDVFGEVYKSNPFWELREKISKEEFQEKLSEQINDTLLIISDLKRKCRDNIIMSDKGDKAKKGRKNLSQMGGKYHYCNYVQGCNKKFLLPNSQDKFDEHCKDHDEELELIGQQVAQGAGNIAVPEEPEIPVVPDVPVPEVLVPAQPPNTPRAGSSNESFNLNLEQSMLGAVEITVQSQETDKPVDMSGDVSSLPSTQPSQP